MKTAKIIFSLAAIAGCDAVRELRGAETAAIAVGGGQPQAECRAAGPCSCTNQWSLNGMYQTCDEGAGPDPVFCCEDNGELPHKDGPCCSGRCVFVPSEGFRCAESRTLALLELLKNDYES